MTSVTNQTVETDTVMPTEPRLTPSTSGAAPRCRICSDRVRLCDCGAWRHQSAYDHEAVR